MEKFVASALLGTVGAVNGGLLAARALEKLQLANLADAPLMIGMTAIVSAFALIAILQAATPILALATEQTATDFKASASARS